MYRVVGSPGKSSQGGANQLRSPSRAQTHAGRQCPTLRGWLSPQRAQRHTRRCLTPAPHWNSALLGTAVGLPVPTRTLFQRLKS